MISEESVILQDHDHTLHQDSKPIREMAAGIFSGIVNCIAGHPFDTIKTRMQILNIKAFQSAINIYQKEGPIAFFKGFDGYLYTYPIIHSIAFTVFELMKRVCGITENSGMTLSQGIIAGSVAGAATCVISTPVELLKVRLQMEGQSSKMKSTGAIKMALLIFKRDGLINLYKGNFMNILREAPSWGTYFAAYETLKPYFKSQISNSNLASMLAGGLSGTISWFFSYPQDVVKSLIQSDVTRKYKNSTWIKDGGAISCTLSIYQDRGFAGFWKGFGITAFRGFFANSLTFMAYERAKDFLMKRN